MSRKNGNGVPPKVRITNGNGFERHESEHADPKSISLKDGVSIIASGGDGDEKPKEVRLFVKVPGVDLAPCVTFRRHEMLTDIIEQLIAFRRYVFPDAPEIDTTKTVDKTHEVVIGEE